VVNKNSWNTFFVLLIISGGPGLCRAEALTWDQCVIEARANNPELLSATRKVDQAVADKRVARSATLPQLSGSAGATTSRVEDSPRSDSYDYGLNARQLLFDGFKTSNDLAAARAQILSAQYDRAVVSSNVRLALREAFIGLVAAQESLKVTGDIAARRRQNLDLIALRYKGGMEHKGSLLRAQADLAQAEFELAQARRNVELYGRRLSRQLGRSKYIPLEAAGTLDAVAEQGAAPDFELLVDATPLLKELTSRKEAARYGLKSARSDLFPQIYADGGARKSGDRWPPRTHDLSAGISVSIPLFEGGRQQAALAAARAAYEQVAADERSGRDGVILTLAETWTRCQDAVAQAGVQAQFLEASRMRAQIIEAQYRAGLAIFDDWIVIEDALVSDQKALVQYKSEAMSAEAAWLQARGETLDE
jgi:outer membrane protein TolC